MHSHEWHSHLLGSSINQGPTFGRRGLGFANHPDPPSAGQEPSLKRPYVHDLTFCEKMKVEERILCFVDDSKCDN